MRLSPTLCLTLYALAGALPAHADITGMVIFGDSLSDNGNTRNLGLSRPINPYYSEGRWTCDNVNTALESMNMQTADFRGLWHERLADRLLGNGNRATASRVGGARATNYAYGGATTVEGITTVPGPFNTTIETGRNMGTQVRDYLSAVGGGAISQDNLYVLWGGGNDMRDAGLLTNTSSQHTYAAALNAVDNIKSQIMLLSGHVRQNERITVLWPNIPPIQSTPEFLAKDQYVRDAVQYGCEYFRDYQRDVIRDLLTQAPNVDIKTLDVYGLFGDLIAGRLAWRPGNTTDNIIAAGDFSATFFTPRRNAAVTGRINPDDYVFWDQIHPTSMTHRVLGDAAYWAVPAPGSTVLWACGLVLAARRRRPV